MAAAVAYALERLSIRNLCYLYFVLSPFFLAHEYGPPIWLVYTAGYLVAVPLVILGAATALIRFSQPVRILASSLPILGIVFLAMFSIAVNDPSLFASPGWHFVCSLKILLPMICFFLIKNCLGAADLSRLYRLLVIMAMAGFIFMAFALPYQLITGNGYKEGRYAFFLPDPNMFALFIDVVFGMTFPVMLRKHLSGRPVVWDVVVNACLAAEVIFSGSRSGLLAMVCIFVVALAVTRRRGLMVKIALTAIPFLLLIGASITIRYTSNMAVRSDVGRLLTYKVGLNAIKDKPLTGVGYENIFKSYDKYGFVYHMLLGRPLEVHNTELSIFSEMGIGGLLCYLAMMFIPAVGIYRRIRATHRKYYPYVELAGLNVLIAYFVCGLFYPHDLGRDNFWAYLAFAYIVWRERNPDDSLVLAFRPPKLI